MSGVRRHRPPQRILVAANGFLPWDLGGYLVRELERRGSHVDTYRYAFGMPRDAASDGLVSAVRTHVPDLVIGLKLRGIHPEALARVRTLGASVAVWYMDCFTTRVPGWTTALARQADVFAVTARGLVTAYHRAGVRNAVWVPEGVCLPAFPSVRLSRADRRTYASDIAFVGSVFQPPVADDRLALRRWRLLDRLGRRFHVKVWGPQNRPARTRALPFPAVSMIRWPAYNEELVKVCASAAIVLGVNTVNNVHQYFSNRTFLTLACGGFHLTHYVPGLEDLFTNHRHLVWFQSDEECADLCAYYLARPTARRRIAREGRRLVRQRWSMARQVSTLLAHVEAASGRA